MTAALAAQVASLASEVAALGTAFEALRAGLATQVRTRRVEVVDEDGFARIVASASRRQAVAGVDVRGGPGDASGAELFGLEPIEHDPAHVGLVLVDSGNVVATIDVFEHALPSMWLATADDHPGRAPPSAG